MLYSLPPKPSFLIATGFHSVCTLSFEAYLAIRKHRVGFPAGAVVSEGAQKRTGDVDPSEKQIAPWGVHRNRIREEREEK